MSCASESLFIDPEVLLIDVIVLSIFIPWTH